MTSKPSTAAARKALTQVAAEAKYLAQAQAYDIIVFRQLSWLWFAGWER